MAHLEVEKDVYILYAMPPISILKYILLYIILLRINRYKFIFVHRHLWMKFGAGNIGAGLSVCPSTNWANIMAAGNLFCDVFLYFSIIFKQGMRCELPYKVEPPRQLNWCTASLPMLYGRQA